MENNKTEPATQQPLTQQHLMAHHVHPEQIYSKQVTSVNNHLISPQQSQIHPNGVMHQLLQSQYHSNVDSRSPLLENRHELYGTGHNNDYARHYGTNDNYNYVQSPPRVERSDLHTDHNVNHELLQKIPKGYNVEVYQDYMKRNPPIDANQIYQNHQPTYRSNMNQYGAKPYLPYSNRIGPQSNTELLRRQYNEIQQMKMQQKMHYQNQAQMQQQQKFAERQLLLQQIHGIHPPPNLQNSIYSDGSYRDLERYSNKNDLKQYGSTHAQKDADIYSKNNEFKDIEKQQRNFEDSQWHSNQETDIVASERQRKQSENEKIKNQYPSPDQNNQSNVIIISPMKSSESSSPSIKSPSSESRKSSTGQALRSPIAQRIPSAPVAMAGILYKQGSDGLKVWRKRWFVLSEYCLFYYKSQDEEKLLGSVLLPSYKVSACRAEDKVLRKYAFKLEHANMRTYILAAPDQEAMMKWVKVLTMAALMQNPNDQLNKQGERAAAKTEDDDETPGPTYVNAPPKPRRSNEGYNSPSPEMYDPNYDLLKKPESHYSQGTGHIRYQENTNQIITPSQESTYMRSPQSPPSVDQQSHYQTKRRYDSHNLSLPLPSNIMNDRFVHNQPSTSNSGISNSNAQLLYFDNRTGNQIKTQENKHEQIYDRQSHRNPFLTNVSYAGISSQEEDNHNKTYGTTLQQERAKVGEINTELNLNSKSVVDINIQNKEMYGELSPKYNRSGNIGNERLLVERRTPDAYGRSSTLTAFTQGKIGDYDDIYSTNLNENQYGKTNVKSSHSVEQHDLTSISSNQQAQHFAGIPGRDTDKVFSGPSVLRRKKMQSSGIQPAMPRPHSADFLEYDSNNEKSSKSTTPRSGNDPPKQPQRPKSSLDINSYYDPSSDKYYSEESYAAKMRQSTQYLQQGLTPRNIQIPLAKYASGLAEKQLQSPYVQSINNNYETGFSTNKSNRDNISYISKNSDLEGINSNWTLKEKGIENRKEYMNRSGSVMSDGSNISNFVKDINKYDSNPDGFMRSASARLPSTTSDKDGEKKIQQREESMKRLLEWKQRMLQSPLTRKSTPATISLARSLTQSRQSLRSDQYKTKTYTNNSYNSYSSDDEASLTMSNANVDGVNTSNQQVLSKKAFLGSNSSIGRNNRDSNIPVRAVSPRVRWVEDKQSLDRYGSQQLSNSQQNLHALNATEDSWMTVRSPSRNSQQPIRAVSPRIRRNTDNNEMQTEERSTQKEQLAEVPSAGELLGRTHEELVLLLIQLRRRHAATHRAIEQCCAQISSIEDGLSSLKAAEREENLQRLEHLKMQLMELEHQYEKSKPLVQLVDNMVKLGSLYNRPGSTVERLERNQKLRQKVLAEHALEQQRWLESAAAGKPLETEAARARVAELWALEQELADEAAILQGLKTDKDTIESLLTGVRGRLDSMPKGDLSGSVGASSSASASVPGASELEAELTRVHGMLALNSKKLEQTVADNARLERELQHLRRALQARRAAVPPAPHPAHVAPTHAAYATAMLEDEVSRVQQLVSALQRQRQELSRAVRHLTQQSQALQTSHGFHLNKRRPSSSWQETNLDTGHTIDHGQSDYVYGPVGTVMPPGHYDPSNVESPLYVDTRAPETDITSPLTSEEMQHTNFGNLSNVEKQEIKTVRIVKRESERRQRDRERSLQPMSDWPTNNITTTLDQFLEEELVQPTNYGRASSVPRTDFTKFEEYYSKPQMTETHANFRSNEKLSSMEFSPKFPSSPSLSNYDYSRDISSLSSSYHRSYERSGYDQTMSLSAQYFNSPTDSSRTLTNDPLSKTSSIVSLTRSHMELSPIFKSEAAKQIITEMSSDVPKNGSIHRRQVPKEKRRHNTAPHHLSAKTLNELPKDSYNQDKLCRSLDDADMERALRAPPDVVRSAIAPQRFADTTIDQLLAAPQKILIPERYIPEKPPELSPEEQQKRQEKVESIKKMLTSTSAVDPNKSPDKEEKKQREHLLQMNQILAKQVTEMSKIIAGTNTDQGPSTEKALEELPQQDNTDDYDDRSPDVELPIYQQRDNFFT